MRGRRPIVEPDGLQAEALDEYRVGLPLRLRQPRRQRLRPHADDDSTYPRIRRRLACVEQDERRLPAADQLDINLGQDFGVEQRTVLAAARIIDAVARARFVNRRKPLAPTLYPLSSSTLLALTGSNG